MGQTRKYVFETLNIYILRLTIKKLYCSVKIHLSHRFIFRVCKTSGQSWYVVFLPYQINCVF